MGLLDYAWREASGLGTSPILDMHITECKHTHLNAPQSHMFFAKHNIEWDHLLETPAPFIPQFQDVEDTTYFARMFFA